MQGKSSWILCNNIYLTDYAMVTNDEEFSAVIYLYIVFFYIYWLPHGNKTFLLSVYTAANLSEVSSAGEGISVIFSYIR